MNDSRFDTPYFTPTEAAQHLHVPASTMQRWLTTKAYKATMVHRLAADTPRSASVPFVSMVEAFVLRELRDRGVKMREIRDSVTRLRRELGTEYALASARLATDGASILVDMAKKYSAPQWERAIDGQRAIDEIMKDYLEYVIFGGDADEYPSQLRLKAYEGADVIIDPRFGFGQPVFAASKVRIEDIMDVFWAGESIRTIADEYGISTEEVESAVRAFTRWQRPAA